MTGFNPLYTVYALDRDRDCVIGDALHVTYEDLAEAITYLQSFWDRPNEIPVLITVDTASGCNPRNDEDPIEWHPGWLPIGDKLRDRLREIASEASCDTSSYLSLRYVGEAAAEGVRPASGAATDA